MADKSADREARHGQKMIEVKLRFWTDEIAPNGRIRPRHAWTAGVVRIERNEAHEITPGDPVPFNSLLEVGARIEEVLIRHNIVLLPSRRMQKYTGDYADSFIASSRSQRSKKANASRTADQRNEAGKKADAKRSPESRSEAARKASGTRYGKK
jgi:hypothetical protein